jgi:hypothetical protein
MRKAMLLMLAAVSTAMLSLPAVAPAGVWHTAQNPSAEKPLNFTVLGGANLWTTPGGLSFPCESMTGAGAYTSKTTGTLTLTFHGCHFAIGQFCGTTGQPAGTVKTTELVVHNITSGHKPAILITPNATTGFFTHSNCPFLETIKGNGIIGTVISPECGQSSKTATLSFSSTSPGVQADRTITTSGTEYTLERNSGEKLALAVHATMSFPESTMMVCT